MMLMPCNNDKTRLCRIGLFVFFCLLATIEIYFGPFIPVVYWKIDHAIGPLGAANDYALVIFLIMLGISRRPFTSVATVFALFGTIVVASSVKIEYLGLPLMLSDLRFFAQNLSANLGLFRNYPALALMLIMALVAWVAVIASGLFFEKPLWRHEPGNISFILRAFILSGAGGVWASIGTPGGSEIAGDAHAQLSQITYAFTKMDVWFHDNNTEQRWKILLNRFFSSRTVTVKLPQNVRQGVFSTQVSRPTEAAVRPDILMVLEESTFDPRLLGGCDQALCESPMFKESRGRKGFSEGGPLLTHSIGGGTWLSEFAFFTGMDWRFFGEAGAFAPISIAPMVQITLPKYLRQMGYRTVAIYPVTGNFLNAREAYRHYGFDDFLSLDEIGVDTVSSGWSGVRDGHVFNKAIDYVRARGDGRPMFVFVLTIRNHGPHGKPPSEFSPAYAKFAVDHGTALADYLERLHGSAVDYEALKKSWLSSERPRVIGWFGDHQPFFTFDYWQKKNNSVSWNVAENVDQAKRNFLTYYRFDANYFNGQRMENSRTALDISFLGDALVRFSGLPDLPGATATRAMRQVCEDMLYECKDKMTVSNYVSFLVHDMKVLQ